MHFAGVGEADYMRIQGTDAVAQFFRQHRYDAVGDIGAAAALVGFLVEWRILGYIVRNIGNRDAQTPSVAVLCDTDSVVEVLRIVAVNGDGRIFGEIDAPLKFSRLYFHGDGFDLFLYIVGEDGIDSAFQKNGKDIDTRLLDISDGCFICENQRLAVFFDGADDLETFLGQKALRQAQIDGFVLELFIVWDEVKMTVIHAEGSDNGRRGMLDDLDKAALKLFAVIIVMDMVDQNGVTVHGRGELICRHHDGEVVVAVDEAGAAAVDVDDALNIAGLFDGGVGTALPADDLIVFLHGIKGVGKLDEFAAALEAEGFGDHFLCICIRAHTAEQLQN